MTNKLQVTLSNDAPPSPWNQNADISTNEGGFIIHGAFKKSEQLKLIQTCARKIQSLGVNDIKLTGSWSIEQQWAFYQGFVTAKLKQNVEWTAVGAPILQDYKTVFDWAKLLVNLPPQDIYPQSLAEQVQSFISLLAPDHVSSEMLIGDELLNHGWVGTHTVGRASVQPPVMLILDYNPSGDPAQPIDYALVGKGITFDSGGYSLKSSEGMLSMKCDMGGAATVSAALALAILQGCQKRVKLILCCAENLVAGNAVKLGDVITYKNGTSVEVVNTDAEGRLVLADGLLLATELGAKHIIDAATLTGAASVALGPDYNALFSLDKSLLQRAIVAAEENNEGAWPLPLEPFHQLRCPSPYADTANSRAMKGGGAGGASNAAGFLSRFVNETGSGWLHIDLAAAFQQSDTAYFAAGATGIGIRTIASLIN
ncbi:aminopeptidase B [Catenovulum agarivorans DS-2]|uniref:Aminopeptidase B n=1 Tax=Catenovulum agarivorans DS-2 TaxID=1328313 RepID=W7QEW1_9ALTE|nr:aminopeptidase PepB [Catenovulum agarivorans]EWH11434.1 aminopeptidase B [Catenovulum agarivorans DS-2]